MSIFNRPSGKPARQASVWIEKYERGEDMEGFGEWVSSSSENSDEFLKMARITRLMQTPEVLKEFDVDAAVVEAREYQRKEKQEEQQRRESVIKRTSLAAVAAGLVLVGGVVAWRVSVADPWERYSTMYQPGREITLTDGSLLRMDTGSTLRVRMSEAERVVDLQAGDVFFKVQRDLNGRPFVVSVPAARIEVTGTEFRVQRQGVESLVQVQDGQVKVIATERSQETRTVTKGREVMIRRDGGVVEIAAVPQSTAPAQPPAIVPSPAADQRRSRPLGEIVDEFNAANPAMRFVVDEAARQDTLYVDFAVTEPQKLKQILESEPGLEVTQDGRDIVVRKRE